MNCGFFGHGDTPDTIKPLLKQEIEKLIINKNVDNFYVGNHGNFDRMVYSVLKELKAIYPDIKSNIVLAYMPSKNNGEVLDTLLPEGIETVPKRFAISWRNKWIVEKSQIIICYINHNVGGVAKYVEIAKKKNITIINLAKY